MDLIWHDERREDQIRPELAAHMRRELIEPPTPDRITQAIRSALHQADERAVAEVAARLEQAGCTRRIDALVFTNLPGGDQEEHTWAEPGGDSDAEDDDVEAVLTQIKAHPGNVSLNSLRAFALVSRFAAVAQRCRGARGSMSLPLITLANSESNRSLPT